jgi:hypothetical protein
MALSKLTAPQAWTKDWVPGAGLTNLFNLYPSKGSVTIAAATNLPTRLDGPIQVARYGALTVNAALSVTNRCRGLVLLCDSLAMGASGSISMTACGAAGSSEWKNQDILIPSLLRLNGKVTSYSHFMTWLAANSYAIFDPTLYACPMPGMGDVESNYTAWPGSASTIISAAGCGASQAGIFPAGYWNQGLAGSNAPGGGGPGGTEGPSAGATCYSAPGHVWGGGMGSQFGRTNVLCRAPDPFGAAAGPALGGGYYNPSAGTGGVVIIICRGAVSLTAGHVISANGVADSTSTLGGGSGGGFAGLYYGGTLAGTPNVTATGGIGSAGGNGGAGAAVSKTFATMGWN